MPLQARCRLQKAAPEASKATETLQIPEKQVSDVSPGTIGLPIGAFCRHAEGRRSLWPSVSRHQMSEDSYGRPCLIQDVKGSSEGMQRSLTMSEVPQGSLKFLQDVCDPWRPVSEYVVQGEEHLLV